MTFRRLLSKVAFRFRHIYLAGALAAVRKTWWRSQGMQIGRATRLSSLKVTWPHKVLLGKRVSLEHDVYFNAAGPYTEGVSIRLGDGCFVGTGCEFNITTGLTVGPSTLIAAGSRFIDHNHGTAASSLMKQQSETAAPIVVGADVWIGVNSVILQGVTIGDGAVVGAGSVVTRSVPSYTVVGGVPARLIRSRAPAVPGGLEFGQAGVMLPVSERLPLAPTARG